MFNTDSKLDTNDPLTFSVVPDPSADSQGYKDFLTLTPPFF